MKYVQKTHRNIPSSLSLSNFKHLKHIRISIIFLVIRILFLNINKCNASFPPDAHINDVKDHNPAIFGVQRKQTNETPVDLTKSNIFLDDNEENIKKWKLLVGYKLKLDKTSFKNISEDITDVIPLLGEKYIELHKSYDFIYKLERSKVYRWRDYVSITINLITNDIEPKINDLCLRDDVKSFSLHRLKFIKKVLVYIKNLNAHYLKVNYAAMEIHNINKRTIDKTTQLCNKIQLSYHLDTILILFRTPTVEEENY